MVVFIGVFFSKDTHLPDPPFPFLSGLSPVCSKSSSSNLFIMIRTQVTKTQETQEKMPIEYLVIDADTGEAELYMAKALLNVRIFRHVKKGNTGRHGFFI